MRLQSSVIAILFVDEEVTRIVLMAMDDVHQASRLLPGGGLQLGEDFGYFIFMSGIRDPGYCQDKHREPPR